MNDDANFGGYGSGLREAGRAEALFKEGVISSEFGCPNFFPSVEKICMGYENAANMLVKQVFSEGLQPDQYLYPIIFLYRQALELRLKNVIHEAESLLNRPKSKLVTHDLGSLWVEVEGLIEIVWPGGGDSQRASIRRSIEAFQQIDPRGTNFRYLTDLNGALALGNLGHENIDLRHFSFEMQELLDYLFGLSAAMLDQREALEEANI